MKDNGLEHDPQVDDELTMENDENGKADPAQEPEKNDVHETSYDYNRLLEVGPSDVSVIKTRQDPNSPEDSERTSSDDEDWENERRKDQVDREQIQKMKGISNMYCTRQTNEIPMYRK